MSNLILVHQRIYYGDHDMHARNSFKSKERVSKYDPTRNKFIHSSYLST